jgi:acetyltransferase-like isoleucine patch superfamily enzyme
MLDLDIHRHLQLQNELESTQWTTITRSARVSSWLRVWQGILSLDIRPLNFMCKEMIKFYLPHCKNCSFSAGFHMLYGNIYAEDASLSNTFFVDYADVHIGRNTGFSFNNMVITSKHDLQNRKIIRAKEIHIGDNVWITTGVIILGGVTIGNNSVIATGSVVTHDIPANVLAAGSPARPIKDI